MQVYNNIFDEKLLDNVVNYSYNLLQQDKLEKNFWTNHSWERGIVLDSSVVLCTDTPTEYSNEIVKSLMKNGLIKTMPDNMSCMIYIWTAGSFIPFHNDEFKDRKLAMTLFLNRDWEKNWGGANIHHNKELDKYILEYPEFNKLLVSDLSENIEQSTTMTTPMSDNRITIQMFI